MIVSPDNGGTVKINQEAPPGYPADYSFGSGEQVTLEAVPAPGYLFRGWNGSLTGNTNPTTIGMDCTKQVIASFSLPSKYQLTIQVNGGGSTSPPIGTYSYNEKTTVNITAVAEKGWKFDGWTGTVSDPAPPVIRVTADADKTLTANFTRILHKVTIQVNGQGATIPPAGSYPYADGTAITISAIPGKGWRFDSWTGNVADSKSPNAAVTVNSDEVYTANFSRARAGGWLIGGGAAGFLVVIAVIWLILKRWA